MKQQGTNLKKKASQEATENEYKRLRSQEPNVGQSECQK